MHVIVEIGGMDMAISIGNTNYSDYYNGSTATSGDKLENKITDSDLSNASDDELMDVCKEFEAYFIEQMYKAMEKTVIKADEDSESDYMSYFGDMQIQEYASQATKGDGIGIAKTLYEQMKRNYSSDNVVDDKTNDTTNDVTQADENVDSIVSE